MSLNHPIPQRAFTTLWEVLPHVGVSGCRTDGVAFDSDLEVTTHPSPIMDFDVDAKRMGLPAFSLEESLNETRVEKEGAQECLVLSRADWQTHGCPPKAPSASFHFPARVSA